MQASDVISLVNALQFDVPDYKSRLSIRLENCGVECDRGAQLCSFLRRNYLAVFSVPSSIPQCVSKKALEIVMQKFADIDRGPWLAVREQQFVMYRGFLGPFSTLSITRHVVSAKSRAYLQFASASRLSKVEAATKGQVELFKTTII